MTAPRNQPLFPLAGVPSVCLSLLDSNGNVPDRSGLNWWRASARDRPRYEFEAYIALRAGDRGSAARVFGSTHCDTVVNAVMHDGMRMRLRLEGRASARSLEAKQVTSDGDKQVLGRWLLQTVLQFPAHHIVMAADLHNYGRTDVCFYLVDIDPVTGERTVYVDFS